MVLLMVLVPLVVVGIVGMIISMILYGIFAIILSLVGGASTALLIKNKTVKKLMMIGFSIFSFSGLASLLPFVLVRARVSELVFTVVMVAVPICIGVLTVVGIKVSMLLQNKIAKRVLVVVFLLLLVVTATLAAFIPVLKSFLIFPS